MPWLDAAWQAPGWFDGDTLPFDVTDRGLLLGDGVFDTSLVLGGRMVWRAAHVARLLAAARTLGTKVDQARVDAAIDAVLARTDNGSMRVTVTRASGPEASRHRPIHGRRFWPARRPFARPRCSRR